MRWHDLGVALALLLVVEGVLPFLNPSGLRRMLAAMAEMTDNQLRVAGLTSMVLGLALLYFINA
ncbi:MAG: DUF2065 domain-containing protein [Pseudomonadota bacterium]|nr:MAG: DUF2065 domain-containing protein [Pseudomonadota bacterium]